MSDSDFDERDRDQFDSDDELRALLRSGDPARALSPADPAALAHLLEDIMSADLELRPAEPDQGDEGSRTTGTHGRNRLTWLVAAAAAAVIAGVGGYAISGLSGGGSPPTASPSQPAADGHAGVAGMTTALTVAAQPDRCAPATPEILAQYPQAFAGTVTAIDGDTVTLQTTEVYNGEVGETVQVTASPALFNSMMSVVQFELGGSYLVASFDGQMSTCYTGMATGDLRAPFEKAFVR